MEPLTGEVTRLIDQYRLGDRAALDRLVPLVYAALRRIAARALRAERDPSAAITISGADSASLSASAASASALACRRLIATEPSVGSKVRASAAVATSKAFRPAPVIDDTAMDPAGTDARSG